MIVQAAVVNVRFSKDSFFILEAVSETGPLSVKVTLFGVDLSGYRRSSKREYSPEDDFEDRLVLKFSGTMSQHEKYGSQLDATSWEVPNTNNLSVVQSNLRWLTDFTHDQMSALVRDYGLDTFKKLDPGSDLPFEGVYSENSFKEALMLWHSATLRSRIAGALGNLVTLNNMQMQQILTTLGPKALVSVCDNPYLVLVATGVNFSQVDKAQGSPVQRVQGLLLDLLRKIGESGHLFWPKTKIYPTLQEMAPSDLSLTRDVVLEAIVGLKDLGVLRTSDTGIYMAEPFEAEMTSATKLAKLVCPSEIAFDRGQFVESFKLNTGFDLSDDQIQALESLKRSKVLVLTGLPGTGKTTVVKAIIKLFKQNAMDCNLLAPTGIAARRLADVTGHQAFTVHKALGYDGIEWAKDKFSGDAVIVDEMSMVDQALFARIVSATPSNSFLVLVGDSAQLPSVGPGNVLRELTTCEPLSRVHLSDIKRQKKDGDIVSNSHRIHRGEIPNLGTDSKSELRFFQCKTDADIRDTVVKLALNLKAKGENFQVMSPMYKGSAGVDSLNEALQGVLNPGNTPPGVFRVGDRLMIVRNNYKKDVSNGDIGRLEFFDRDSFLVKVYGAKDQMSREVSFTKAEAEEYLRLSYAITVHKSQGCEFDTVVLPMSLSQSRMLQRNLFYTAVTRAKKRVLLVGHSSAIETAVANNDDISRFTRLNQLVCGVLTGESL